MGVLPAVPLLPAPPPHYSPLHRPPTQTQGQVPHRATQISGSSQGDTVSLSVSKVAIVIFSVSFQGDL